MLAWLPVLKAETKASVERVARELHAQARLESVSGSWRRARGERPPKGGQAEPGADLRQFMAGLDTGPDGQKVYNPLKGGGIQFGTQAQKAAVREAWIAEAKQIATERRQKDAARKEKVARRRAQQQP